MNYTHYTAQQFAQDEHFQDWILHPTPRLELFWENFLQHHPYKQSEIDQARALLLGWHFEEPVVPSENIVRLRQRVMEEAVNESIHHPVIALRYWSFAKVAASVTVLFVLTALAYWFLNPAQDWATYETAYGEVKTISLPDGSTVTLNANSRLRFPEQWETDANREVWLEGEAYFQVAKQLLPSSYGTSSTLPKTDEKLLRKFLVNANELKIAVVGTQFNVYARQAKTEVVLEEGIVVVNLDSAQSEGKQTVRMQPGEKITYQERQLTQQLVNPSEYTSWRNRQLVFHAVPLSKVAQTIEETYGIAVVFANPNLEQQVFTGTVPSANLEVLLEALTGIYQLEINQQKDQLVFSQTIR